MEGIDEERMDYISKQPLEELMLVESGVYDIKEIQPIVTLKGKILHSTHYLKYRAYQLC
jgi:hypothetical protein